MGTEEMMASNTSIPELQSLTERPSLGAVTAFLSHSWRDDPVGKWNEIQQWREDFKHRHAGREPTLWIDKFCIDQANITESLQVLPVYLAGCQRLLVILGKTYLTRLWCLVKLFVFFEMGGTGENLVVRVLSDDDERALEQRVAEFDSRNATCFHPEEANRLLSVIEGSFGTLDRFNDKVRRALQEALKRTNTCASMSSASSATPSACNHTMTVSSLPSIVDAGDLDDT